jgi:hypothetical protein
MRQFASLLIVSFVVVSTQAQTLRKTKAIIRDLCSEEMKGRGYVENGVNLAAAYLESYVKKKGLSAFGGTYRQSYTFPVNTHPYDITCIADKHALRAGYDFLVDAGSKSVNGTFNLTHVHLSDTSKANWLIRKIKSGFEEDEALVVYEYDAKKISLFDSFVRYNHFPALLIKSEPKKLTHTIRTSLQPVSSLTIMDSCIRNKTKLQVSFQHQFIPEFTSSNICGYIEGKRNDSMIVFSAHYDHLGKLGPGATFPGASDNASGTAMLCYLMTYYKKHKPDYTTVFIFFSGEEAGLLGSSYFTKHPMFDLTRIKYLINIDIMGNAEKGIVVVNGETFPEMYQSLVEINNKNQYLPEVRIRGKASNSDHHHFSELGIPSVFIYSNGGKGYYHDVFDTASSNDLTNFKQVARLLIKFAR